MMKQALFVSSFTCAFVVRAHAMRLAYSSRHLQQTPPNGNVWPQRPVVPSNGPWNSPWTPGQPPRPQNWPIPQGQGSPQIPQVSQVPSIGNWQQQPGFPVPDVEAEMDDTAENGEIAVVGGPEEWNASTLSNETWPDTSTDTAVDDGSTPVPTTTVLLILPDMNGTDFDNISNSGSEGEMNFDGGQSDDGEQLEQTTSEASALCAFTTGFLASAAVSIVAMYV